MTTRMMILSTFLATLLAVAATDSDAMDDDSTLLRNQFDRWRLRHGKTLAYNANEEEYSHRLSVFARNAAVVSKHNDGYRLGYTSYAMSVDGPFADLTDEEFENLYLMTPQNCSATHTSSGPIPRTSNDPLPASVDWRTRGVMTPIKSQGHCGSCWTFSTTGTLEAHHCIQEGKDCTHWKGLAEQQLVDCAGAYNNNGCDGGLPSQAFEYIQYNGGIMTEETYDYTAEDGTCKKMVPEDIGATVNGVFNISSLDEDEIVAAVADIGPVSVAYQVSGDFRLYSHGVYDSWNATTNETACSSDPSHVNHAVVAVGYGETSDDEAIPFHIIRNSWGNTWGMEGHFWILRGQNLCGISDCASFPLVPSQGRQQYSLRTRTAPEIPAAFS